MKRESSLKSVKRLIICILVGLILYTGLCEQFSPINQYDALRKGFIGSKVVTNNNDNLRNAFAQQIRSQVSDHFAYNGINELPKDLQNKQSNNIIQFTTIPFQDYIQNGNYNFNKNGQSIPPPKVVSNTFGNNSSQNDKLVQTKNPTNFSNYNRNLDFFSSYGNTSIYQKDVYSKQNPLFKLLEIKRSSNGWDNNKKNPSWGSANTELKRILPPTYLDGYQTPVNDRPNIRTISNIIGGINNDQLNLSDKSLLFVIFGQFTDHDLDLTKEQQGNYAEQMRIPVPRCDAFFDPKCTGQQYIPFKRANYTSSRPRQYSNIITSFIDGGNIYGSSQNTTSSLRAQGTGQLITSHGDMLQQNLKGQYMSGDIRVNQNAILTSIHTLFQREHNRICKIIERKFPHLTRQQSFLMSKNYVIGLIQKITYDDFLPEIFGKDYFEQKIGKYKGYHQYANPTIPLEFSAAAFRFGHSLLVDKVSQINQYNQLLRTINVEDLFFRPSLVTQNSLGQLLKGAAMTKSKRKDGTIVNAVRNFLIPSPDKRNIKLDLFSINVQRGRDLGLADYNSYRVAHGLKRINDFREICNPVVAEKLRKAYGSVDKIDLWVGIVAQQSVPGGIIGPLGAQILGNVFKNVRDGDRFWYENTFPPQIITQFKQTTLADLIKRNTDITILPKNVFAA